MKEYDPDTLQILDETDEEWVKLWANATDKKSNNKNIFFETLIYPLKKLYA